MLGPEITKRSMHKHFTPTSGGLVFLLAAGMYAWIMDGRIGHELWLMLGGALILGILSLIDDMHELPPVPRLIVQVGVTALAFNWICSPDTLHIYLIMIFCAVGFINAFNFLDGIAGMLALYGIVVVGTLLYALSVLPDAPASCLQLIPLCVCLLLALVVFAVFNLPDLLFAGDVGSITLGYIIAYIIGLMILTTGDIAYACFALVCVFDTGLTTMQRLFAGENILLPHCQNLYQILTMHWKIPHLTVSIAYALLQLLINALFFLIPAEQHPTYLLIVIAMLTVTYFSVRGATRRKI